MDAKKLTYQSNVLHESFHAWLRHISLKPEIAALYFAIMEDIFKKNEGDRQEEVKKLQKQIDDNSEMINKSLRKFVNDDLSKSDYDCISANLSIERLRLTSEIAEVKTANSGYKEYSDYGFSLLGNMNYYYKTANTENKQRMLGLIFPEKLVFTNNTFQTTQPNEILTLLCNTGKGFSDSINGLSRKNAGKSCEVTPPGFKPGTS